MRLIDADELMAEIMDSDLDHLQRDDWREIIQIVQDAPTIQTQYKLDEFCTDCKEYDKERHSCPRWNRVIRQTAEDMKAAQPHWIHVTNSEQLPSAQPEIIR